MNSRTRITHEVIQKSLQAISDEMFAVLGHTAHGVIMYEMLDYCVGVLDDNGRLVVQGNGLPIFIAMLEPAVVEVLRKYGKGNIRPGDVFILNDPYAGGGTHLKDVCLVKPVFHREELIAFVANKGHWSEMGGKDPTNATDSTEIWQEGLQLPNVKLFDQGKLNGPVKEIIEANVRLPLETMGDFEAALAAASIGEQRLVKLAERYGGADVRAAIDDLLDYTERLSRVGLGKLPKGTFYGEDWVDDDGITADPILIRCRVDITDDAFTADFTGTSPEVRGPFNCGRSGLHFAVDMVFKALTSPSVPASHGTFRPVRIICPDGTVLTARRPAPTGRYHQPAMIAVEAMLKALAPSCRDAIPAGNLASACGANIVGTSPNSGRMFVIVEPLIGGWGAAADRDGQSGLFYYACGETRNIPVEVQEAKYGLHVVRYEFHQDDGGEGRFRGGKGVVLEYLVSKDPVFLTGDFGRHKFSPWAVEGAREGSRSSARIIRLDGREEIHHRPSMVRVEPGERIILTTATGGGHGAPLGRDRQAVISDLRDGYVTGEQARRYYGFSSQEAGP